MRSVYISDKKKKGCVFVWVISCNTISRNFPIRKGLEIPWNLSQNIIPFAAFSIIPFLEEEASYPVEKAGFVRETNPLTNLLIYSPIFRFRFLDTRVFLFLFFIHGLETSVLLLEFHREFRFEDDSRIVGFIAISTFTARRRSTGGNELVVGR